MQEPRTHAQRVVPPDQSPDLELQLELDSGLRQLTQCRGKNYQEQSQYFQIKIIKEKNRA